MIFLISLLVLDFQRSVWSVPSISVAVLALADLIEQWTQKCNVTAIFKLESIDFYQGNGMNDTYCFYLDTNIETSQDPDTNL